MAAKVSIMRRIKLEGKWSFHRVIINPKNGKIQPDYVRVDGQDRHLPGTVGRYYLDFLQDGRRKHTPAGATAAEAQTAAKQQDLLLTARKANTAAGLPQQEPEIAAGSRSLKNAVETYLIEIKAHKKTKTYAAYSIALNYFLQSCRKPTLESIDRTDLLKFVTYLREKGQADRTVRNKFENVITFLKAQKILGIAEKGDWPRFVEKAVKVYEKNTLDTLFETCDADERLWYEFFLMTGMREQEVMHCSWSDVNLNGKTITVRANPKYNFSPKNYEEREIPIPEKLIKRLTTWKEQADKTCGLVFPTTGCRPKLDFLDCLKAVVKRAGLNPDDFILHRFRATFCTWHLRSGTDLRTVQHWMGHKDLESTMRYLKPNEGAGVREKVNATFA
jgi:integrase/recombinase XerD